MIIDGVCSGCRRQMSLATCTFVIAVLALPLSVARAGGHAGAGIGLYLRSWDLARAAVRWESVAPAIAPGPLEWVDLRAPIVDDALLRQLAGDLHRSLRAGMPAVSDETLHAPLDARAPWAAVERPCFRLGLAESLFDLALEAGADLHRLRAWHGLVAAASHPAAG